MTRISEPKEHEPFFFTSTKDFQTFNKRANELGLRARIIEIEVTTEGRQYTGKWVKNETPSERS